MRLGTALVVASLIVLMASQVRAQDAGGSGTTSGSTTSTAGGPQPENTSPAEAIPQQPSPTPQPDPSPSDTTSKTCNVTVPMLQAIPCEKYPAEIQSFCNKYKPMQMDMDQCQRAERYARMYPPAGKHLDECRKQTFDHGTSSWSYVLACAPTPTDQGAAGDSKAAQNKLGITNGDTGATGGTSAGGATASGSGLDPQCLSKLQGMGAKFQNQGQVDHGQGPKDRCIVRQQVLYSNRDVKYTGTMDCNLALAFEQYGKALKGLGVTRIDNFGTLGCRGITNSKVSNSSAHQSLHSYGYAADMDAWDVNGQTIHGNQYYTDASKRPIIQQILNVTCENFPGVLAFNFYRGAKGIHHIHGQVKQHTSRCDPDP